MMYKKYLKSRDQYYIYFSSKIYFDYKFKKQLQII